MKYVAVAGGLGNQMFNKAFAHVLCLNGSKAKLLIVGKLNEHAGRYELARVFGIPKESRIWSWLFNIPFNGLFRRLFSLNHKIVFCPHYNYQENILLDKTIGLYFGTVQCSRYYDPYKSEIQKLFTFKVGSLSAQTLRIKEIIDNCTSVCVHVRRGDYLNPGFYQLLGCCCPLDYYERAIEYIYKHVPSPTFIFFSDDMEWVKENFKVERAVYVTHNIGLDAWQDMWLMTQCKHNIIANSSFSWWGAWLGTYPNKIVVAPLHWQNGLDQDDVPSDTWIRM